MTSPSLKPCCWASLRPMTQALRSCLNAASWSGASRNSGYRSKYVSGSTARRGQKFLKSLGSPYTPPNQLAHETAATPGIRAICWRYGSGTGKMNDTLWCVIIRFSAEAATPAFHAPTIGRIRPNAITAVAIPSIVRIVRSRCRNRFLRTILSSFTLAPSLQLAFVEVPHDVRSLGGVRIVRHHHDGLLELLVQPLEQREHLFGGLTIEVARRLVRHEDGGVGREGARDGHALLLAARELPRIMVYPVLQADQRERRFDMLAPLGLGERAKQQRQLDVLVGREHWNQVVELKHEPDVPGPPTGELRFAQLRDVRAGDRDRPRVRAIDARDQVQQRGLARPRGAHQAEKFSLRNVERDVVQHGDRHAVAAVGLRDTANLDDRIGHELLYCTVTLTPPRRRAPTLSTTGTPGRNPSRMATDAPTCRPTTTGTSTARFLSTTNTTLRPFRSATEQLGATRTSCVSTATRDGRGRKWRLALISGSTRASYERN